MATAVKNLGLGITTLSALARHCIETTGDRREAEALAKKILASDPVTYEAVAVPILDSAIENAIGNVIGVSRVRAFQCPKGVSGESMSNGKGILLLGYSYLNSYRMADGSLLGDADKGKVQDQIGVHAEQIKGQQLRVDFLSKVATRLKGKKRVRDVWKDEELAELAAA